MVRQFLKIGLIALVLASVGAQAQVPALVSDTIRMGMESYARYVEKDLVKQADNPKQMERVLHYLFLKDWLQHYRHVLHNPERTEQELKQLEETLVLPAPDSKDGKLIAQSIYLRQLLPDAVAARMKDIESRPRDPYGIVDEYNLERTMRKLGELIRELRTVEDSHWFSDAYRERERERLSKEISAQYEEVMLNITQLEPNALETTLLAVAASLVEAAIMVATVAFVAGNFKGPEVLGITTLTGYCIKALHALYRSDVRFLLPFWGVVDRTQRWTQAVRNLGFFPSQWFARRRAAISAPLLEADFSKAESRHFNECGALLADMAFEKAQRVPFFDSGTRLKQLHLPAGLR
jgi:hypothetical protein